MRPFSIPPADQYRSATADKTSVAAPYLPGRTAKNRITISSGSTSLLASSAQAPSRDGIGALHPLRRARASGGDW